MDKQLKAELSALKNEVITGLKGLEGLMGKIDTKLAESEEEASLAKCPNLGELLTMCSEIDFDKPLPEYKRDQFKRLVSKVTELFAVTESERYAAFSKSILDMSKKLDAKIDEINISGFNAVKIKELENGCREFYIDTGSLSPEKATMIVEQAKDLFDNAQPEKLSPAGQEILGTFNTLDKLEKEFEKVKKDVFENHPAIGIFDTATLSVIKEGGIPGIDDTDVLENVRRMENAVIGITKYLDDDKSKPRTPEWLENDSDRKLEYELVKEAKTWDDYNQDLFQRQWNSYIDLRIKLTREALDILLSELLNYKPGQVTISSPEEANRYLTNSGQFTNSRTSIELILRRVEDDVLLEIEEDKTNPLNFKKYYDWCAKIAKQIATHNYSKNSMLSPLVIKILNDYQFLMNNIEREMFVDAEADSKSAEWGVSAEYSSKIKEYSYTSYTKDLKQAYEYVTTKKETDNA